MNKYKVEFIQTEKFIVDVRAKTEKNAIARAEKKWNTIAKAGLYHYHQTQEAEVEVGTVYDVTNTDDPFSP